MPHLIIEHSANVSQHHDVSALLDAVHGAILELDIAPVAGVRIRAIEQDDYRIAGGDNPDHAYVAMVARLGPGRDAPTKHRLIEAVLDAAEAQFATEDSQLVIAWSLEVQEIDAEFRVNRNHVATAMKGAL